MFCNKKLPDNILCKLEFYWILFYELLDWKNIQQMKSTYVQSLFLSHNSYPNEKHKHETSKGLCATHVILYISYTNNQFKCILHLHQTTWEYTVCHWSLQFSSSLIITRWPDSNEYASTRQCAPYSVLRSTGMSETCTCSKFQMQKPEEKPTT